MHQELSSLRINFITKKKSKTKKIQKKIAPRALQLAHKLHPLGSAARAERDSSLLIPFYLIRPAACPENLLLPAPCVCE